MEDLFQNLVRLQAGGEAHPLLIKSLYLAWTNLAPPPGRTVVFTDDLSPIEWLTNNLILNYLLESGVGSSQ